MSRQRARAAAGPAAPENLHAIIEREAAGLPEAQRWKLEQSIAWRLHEMAFPGDALIDFVADSPIPYRLVRR